MIAQLKKLLLVVAVVTLFVLYAVQERPQTIAIDPKSLAYLQTSTPIVRAPSPSNTPMALIPKSTPTATAQVEDRNVPVTTQSTRTTQPVTAAATNSLVPPTEIPTETAIPTATQSGAYVDGVYTGSEVDAHWGYVTVVTTVSNGEIVDVQFTEYPNHRNRSQEINNYAMPELIQEAIQAQSSEVDLISGATDTSRAFVLSLQSALQQAAA